MTANLIMAFCFAVATWLAYAATFAADNTAQQAGPWLAWAVFIAVLGLLHRITKPTEREQE